MTYIHPAESDQELHGLLARGQSGDFCLLLVLLGVIILVTREVAGSKVQRCQLGFIVRS